MKSILQTSQMLVLFAIISVEISAQWETQVSGTTNDLRGVSFTDGNNGTAVGQLGTILSTTDGGANWVQQTSGTTNDLRGVSFIDANVGTVVGQFGTILRTTDGGATWTEQTSGVTTIWLERVSFIDANNGLVVGQSGTILKTTDGGANWSEQTSGTTVDLRNVSFIDANNGYVVGQSGTILATKDGGANWTEQSSGTTNNLVGVSFTDALTGTVVGIDGIILRTTDGGTTWVEQTSGTIQWLLGVSFTDTNYGEAVGTGGTNLRTTDGGTTWTQQTNVAVVLYDVSFISANSGTVVGENGTILRMDITNSLVAYFPFNGNADDESGNGNHGSVMGATLTDDRFGNANSAYHFDGVDDYIDIGNNSILKMVDGVTISVWVNVDYFPLSGWHNIISDHSPSHNNGKILRFQDNGIEFLLDSEGTPEARYNLPDTIAGTWQHIAATYDGISVKLFVNGIMADSTERTGELFVNPNPLLIGKSGWGEYFPGAIDEVVIYDVGLTNSQVADLYQGNIVSVGNDDTNELPKNYTLNQNYPNPFNPSTKIKYSVQQASNVVIKVFDIIGNEIETLVNEEKQTGTYEITWNAQNLPSGIYFYRLSTESYIETKKMVLMK